METNGSTTAESTKIEMEGSVITRWIDEKIIFVKKGSTGEEIRFIRSWKGKKPKEKKTRKTRATYMKEYRMKKRFEEDKLRSEFLQLKKQMLEKNVPIKTQ